MIFENEMLSFNILDVLYLDQENVDTYNSVRRFDALSYRISSDATIHTTKGTYSTPDGTVAFVPSLLDYKRVASHDELIVVHFNVIGYVGRDVELLQVKDSDRIRGLFAEILRLWEKKEDGYEYECAAIFYKIFAECYRECQSSKSSSSKIAPSVKYMLENFRKSQLTVAEVAAKSFMSEVYFRRLFREEFGTSPKKYLISLRIKYAISLIFSGYYSLSEVAYMSGYDDYKYFSTEFKRTVGVSPGRYSYEYDGVGRVKKTP